MDHPSTLKVTISDVVYNGSNLSASNRYRLKIRALSVRSVLRVTSDYLTYTSGTLEWRTPLGFCCSPLMVSSSLGSVKISLRRSRGVWFDETVARCELDLKPRVGKETVYMVSVENQKTPPLLSLMVSVSVVNGRGTVKEAIESPGLVTASPKLANDESVTNVATTAAAAVVNAGEDNDYDSEPDITASLSIVSNRMLSLLGFAELMLGIGDAIAELHPLIKLTWGAVAFVAKAAVSQVRRDAKIRRLAHEMAQASRFVEDVQTVNSRWKGMGQTIRQILQQVTQCAYFINSYTSGSFGRRAAKMTAPLVDKQIAHYIENFNSLQNSLQTHTTIHCNVMVGRVVEAVDRIERKIDDIGDQQVLDGINYAHIPNSMLKTGCLPGTREEVIDIIVHWAAQSQLPPPGFSTWNPAEWEGVHPDPSARVLWICGLSGSGKSTILQSVTMRLRELGCLGASFAFSDTTRTVANPGNLFGTLARSLAIHDPLRKRSLIDVIKLDQEIRTTTDCLLQFKSFIVAPSNEVVPIGDTVIVIDAFDESGAPDDRAALLEILTTRAHEIPPGLRFIITSRFESDVQAHLTPLRPRLALINIDELPRLSITRDISAYVHKALEAVPSLQNEGSLLTKLAVKAELSFQWASMTCHFVKSSSDGDGLSGPKERLLQALDGENNSLDHIYFVILDRNFARTSDERLEPLTTIFGFIISAQGSLSLRVLVALASHAGLSENHLEEYQRALKLLASLLYGTHNVTYPITILHTSFAEFLQDSRRSKRYFVDIDKYTSLLALGCLHILENGLSFNICRFPTSHKRNKEIKMLSKIVLRRIPAALQYACKFWPYQVAKLRQANTEVHDAAYNLLQNRVLEWLEATSLLEYVYPALDALLQLASSKVLGERLVALAREIASFVEMFAVPIAESAPHVYLSAMPFVPERSGIRSPAVCSSFSQTVVLKQGRLHDWPRAVFTLQGHTYGVTSVAFSPDGQQIVSGSADKTVRIWNARTGFELRSPLEGHTDRISSVAYSPDGSQIASAGADKSIYLWDSSTGSVLGMLMGHTKTITTIAFSPEGRMLASGSEDETIRLWNMDTRVANGLPLRGHEDTVSIVAFSPISPHILASASRDGTIRVWDLNTGDTTNGPWTPSASSLSGLSFSPDGKQLACCGSTDSIRVLDAETGTQIGDPLIDSHKFPTSVLFSPDGAHIVAAMGPFSSTAIYVWDTKRPTNIPEILEGHSRDVMSIAVSPDSLRIASGSDDKTIRIWNAKTGGAIDSIETPKGHTFSISCVAISPGGSRVVSGSFDNSVRVWDAQTGEPIGKPLLKHTDAVMSVEWSPNGKFIASCSADGTACIWDAYTGDLIGDPLVGHDGLVWRVVFSPDSTRVASCAEDETVRFWSTKTGEMIGEPWSPHASTVNSIAFSPDGTLLVTGSSDYTARVWEADTLIAVGGPLRHASDIFAVAFSPDGSRVASISFDGCVHLWDARAGASIGDPFMGHKSEIWTFTFHPDGLRMAYRSKDAVMIWSAKTDAIEKVLIGHTREISALAFFPDGTQLVSGSFDKSIRIWDLGSAEATAAQERLRDEDGDDDHDSMLATVPDAYRNRAMLQYPPSLFPNDTFTFENNWILGPKGEPLLWVHPCYQEGLCGPGCRVVGAPQVTELDFSYFKCGPDWAQCRKALIGIERWALIEPVAMIGL